MKVCAPCGKKIVFHNKVSENFLLSEKHITLLKNYINEKFDISNNKFPTSICVSCRLTISELEKGISKRPLPTMPNYEDVNLAKETRNHNCNCYICLTARSTSHSKTKKGRGHFRKFSDRINVNNGINGTLQNISPSESNKVLTKAKTSIDICSSCFQEIGKGVSHICKGPSFSSARENVINMIENLPDKQQNQVVTTFLKRKLALNESKDGDLVLNTRGSKVRVTLNNKKEKKIIFSAQNLDNFQSYTGSSTNYMRKMTNFLRSHCGRDSISSNYNDHMHKKSTMMDNIYKEDIYKFETAKGEIKDTPVVYADASELLEFVIEKRDIKNIQDAKIKLMADGGQNFFKFSLSILTQEEENEHDSNEIGSRKVSSYSTGGSIGNKRKLTSVNRLILLCIVPQIKETYENIKTLVELTKLNDIPLKFSSDFKLLLIILGMQTATATYPCPYCFTTLSELESFDQVIDETDSNFDDKNLSVISLKTFKDLKEDYCQFKTFGNDKKKAKECRNTIHHPLFVQEDDDDDDYMYVLAKCVPPELHLMQGFVNHLFWNGIAKVVGMEKALLWPKRLGIIHKSYQGNVFEGNQCRKLLAEVDKLQDPEIYEFVGQYRLQPYVASFKAMNKIVNSCFTTKQVDLSDLDKNLSELRAALKSTNVSQTLKIHVILEHLKSAITLLNNDGLGLWSEQAGESIHREFIIFWNRFKINNIDDPTFSSRLKKAVATFSSQRI